MIEPIKKGILIIIGIIIIGITYLGIKTFGYSKEITEDSKKAKFSKYQNSELILFYKDFEKEITEIIWTDEPPIKLSGVIFKINENKYYEIELDSIPKTHKVNLERDWKIHEVGESNIRSIKLIER
ncbi:hypothetical protein ACSIGC_09355 [Tenacibaculum sp. ZS6-P6]|uniref:hypothetical protein n=1 Tax=Tenacibaculum sp. ZS6-P6 TaxID=3447503 RepID=UPI003F960C6C